MKKIFLFIVLLIAVFVRLNSYAQSVGIGTQKPLEKLHVAGNIRSDTIKADALKLVSNAGAGKILTSDDAGNASWQKISKGSSTESNLSVPGNIGYGVWGDCATNGNISDYQPMVDTVSFPSSTYFGYSVHTSGNYAIVGIIYDIIGGSTKGSVNIYQHDGTKWVLMQKLTDPAGASLDDFGSSVCISGNYAIVGSGRGKVGSNNGQGSASIFQFNGTSWVLMQKITDASGALNDNFGTAVSISGNLAVVGSPKDDHGASTDQGSVLFYKYNGTSWVQLQKVFDPTGLPNDNFGASVSISGNYAVVGAHRYDVGAIADQGAAVVYQYNGTNWAFMQRITDPGGAAGDLFGKSVSISGNYFIVGASSDDIVINFSYTNIDQGSASMYQLKNGSWVMMERLTDPAGAASDHFGSAVSISDNYAVVGAILDDVGTVNEQGAASIFQRVGTGWQRLQYVTDPGGKEFNRFSSGGVSIDAITKRFIVGVLQYSSQGKVVFGKIN